MISAAATLIEGTWTAVVGPTCWALVDLPEEEPRVEAARRAVFSEAPVLAVVEALGSAGLAGIPSFAVVGECNGGLRYVVRQPASVEASAKYDGGDALTWADGILPPDVIQPGCCIRISGSGDSGSLSVVVGDGVDEAKIEPLDGAARYAVLTSADTGVRDQLLDRLRQRSAPEPAQPSGPGLPSAPPPGEDGHNTAVWDETAEVSAGQRDAPGRLAFSTGLSILLDKDVVIGRAPRTDVVDPAARPNVVKLADSHEISRMHASVRLVGGRVLVRDLGSANGTSIRLPGCTRERLDPGRDREIAPGTVVGLADVVEFIFEGTK